MPRISIIVPVYKVEPYLRRCVDSILAQTFADFELILVDDGSPDRCGAICDEYAAADSRVHVIHQKNGGLSAARNAGIDWVFANSDSQWLTFVDSDDWVHPEYLYQLYTAAKEHSTLISMCSLHEMKLREEYAESIPYKSEALAPREAYIHKSKGVAAFACGRLYHKEHCFMDIRFPVGRQWEDLATIYKILWNVPRVAVVNGDLYYYYVNPMGISRSAWTPKKLDELKGYEEQLPFFLKKKEREICRRLASAYMMLIFSHDQRVQDSDITRKEKTTYRKLLKKKQRVAIYKYRSVAGISIAKDAWIYEMAYPHLMAFYWLGKACLGKLKRK